MTKLNVTVATVCALLAVAGCVNRDPKLPGTRLDPEALEQELDCSRTPIREALLRERYRGGQSFYVVPRISDLADAEQFLREQVPEVRVVTAHGQMAAGEVEDLHQRL